MNKTLIIVVILVMGLTGASVIRKFFLKPSVNFAKPIGNLRTVSANSNLQSHINSYMESQKSEYALGKENYHCGNFLYGYDDKYAYALVYCSGFLTKDNKVEQGSAFGSPIRLEYLQPDFQIINFQQPRDGSLYDSDFRSLFPEKLYQIGTSSNTETNKLVQEVRNKAKTSTQ